MKDIRDYTILEAYTTSGLIENVQFALSCGWQPYGQMIIEPYIQGDEPAYKYLQPMTMDEESQQKHLIHNIAENRRRKRV